MNERKIKSFQDLDAWKQCRILRKDIWLFCKTLPPEEKFRLVDQLIRASRSVTANIAEGYGRFGHQENIQFCRTSRASLYELIDHMTTAEDCEYMNHSVFLTCLEKIERCIILMNGYINYLIDAKKRDSGYSKESETSYGE
ncbi:MAG: four helix bundle protein [Bacteroidota bacterium]